MPADLRNTAIQQVNRTKRRSRAGSFFVNFLLVVSSLLTLFLLLEVAARVYVTSISDRNMFRLYASQDQFVKRDKRQGMRSKYSLHRYLGYIPAPELTDGQNRNNIQGFRGEDISMPKPKGEIRIACLGGSTTYCSCISDYKSAWPYQLEQLLQQHGLNVRVVNAGVPNYTTLESLINLQCRVLELDPDIVVIYHGVNDLLGRLVWPPQAFKSDNSGSREPIGEPRKVRFYERSSLVRIFLVRSGLLTPQASLDFSLNCSAPTYVAEVFKQQWRSGTYPSGLFAQHPVSEIWKVNSDHATRRNIKSMVAIAQQHKIVPILMSFAWSPDFPAYAWASSPEFHAAYKLSNQMIKEIALETSVPFFDFASVFPPSPDYYTDGIHVNEQGAQVHARLLCEFLLNSEILKSQVKKQASK